MRTAIDPVRLRQAYERVRDTLLAERTAEGYWIGELSSSALSTATAVTALSVIEHAGQHTDLIRSGICWLVAHQNPDGGWGDTVKSLSNISTTMLCRAAFYVTGQADQYASVLRGCEKWLSRHGHTPEELAEAVRNRYGKDRTFSVPILMMCALAGLIPWREVPRLPFELACVPQSWYRFARMPVVSYALPALIAIGQVVHFHRSTWNPLTRVLRWLGKRRSLWVLERIQPSSGGYLEAAPLTSFVIMSLASIESTPEAARRVISRGVNFLKNSVRPDGSWPIDSNLSIWLTTLSVNALSAAGDLEALDRRDELLAWLLHQQTKETHPYTGAAPGSWGWSHFPGSVPDCDDTPGALLAIRALGGDGAPAKVEAFVRFAVGELTFIQSRAKIPDASGDIGFHALNGLAWVRDLQNSDGGWPTFCRGWGKLPFDRSGSDLSAHALRAFAAWGEPGVATAVAGVLIEQSDFTLRAGGQRVRFISRRNVRDAVERGFRYLRCHQRSDGSWLPLWFGNQHAPDDINPVYGTAKVLAAYRDLGKGNDPEAVRGVEFVLAVQNADGGWGGAKETPSSVEETALALEVLLDLAPNQSDAIHRGLEYLIRRVEDGTFTEPSPIGFYFAKLWYFEKLYPIIFSVAALGRAVRKLSDEGS
jgi:squalene-hopene/tetraprenyl-beta-curcumene cyclase